MAVIQLDDVNQNKLGIVNRCLQSIGEAPLPQGTLPSEFPLGSDAQVASSVVDDVYLNELSKGWWFNTDVGYKLYPDSNDFISFPETVIRIDSGRYQPYIKKQGMLYNTADKTFKFTEPVESTIIWVVSYSDLPVTMYEYIAAKASRRFQQNVIGAPEQTAALKQDEIEALADLQRESNQYLDQSMISTQVSNRWANPRRGL